MAEGTVLQRQRDTCVRSLLALAEWLERVPRASDQVSAQELRAYVLRFADAETSLRHWPMDGPLTLDTSSLMAAAAALERAFRTRIQPAQVSYAAGELGFPQFDQVVRGILG